MAWQLQETVMYSKQQLMHVTSLGGKSTIDKMLKKEMHSQRAHQKTRCRDGHHTGANAMSVSAKTGRERSRTAKGMTWLQQGCVKWVTEASPPVHHQPLLHRRKWVQSCSVHLQATHIAVLMRGSVPNSELPKLFDIAGRLSDNPQGHTQVSGAHQDFALVVLVMTAFYCK